MRHKHTPSAPEATAVCVRFPMYTRLAAERTAIASFPTSFSLLRGRHNYKERSRMLVDGAIIGTAKAAVEGVDFVVKRPSKNNTCAEKPRMEDRNRRQQLGTKNVARHRRHPRRNGDVRVGSRTDDTVCPRLRQLLPIAAIDRLATAGPGWEIRKSSGDANPPRAGDSRCRFRSKYISAVRHRPRSSGAAGGHRRADIAGR